MESRVVRMFFDRGVVFMPAGGRVLLTFLGDTEPLDLTPDFPLLLEAGLVLLDEPSAGRAVAARDAGGRAIRRGDASRLVDVATFEFPDRMRVYREGRRLSGEEVGAAVEASVVSALRAALAAHAS